VEVGMMRTGIVNGANKYKPGPIKII